MTMLGRDCMERNEFQKKRRKLMEDNQKFSQPPTPPPMKKWEKKKQIFIAKVGTQKKKKVRKNPLNKLDKKVYEWWCWLDTSCTNEATRPLSSLRMEEMADEWKNSFKPGWWNRNRKQGGLEGEEVGRRKERERHCAKHYAPADNLFVLLFSFVFCASVSNGWLFQF
jgi:hypothetical protein